MPLQTYLVHCTPACDTEGVRLVAAWVRDSGGLILMATRQRVLIIAIDDARVEVVRKHPAVNFVGGVTLDARGEAARQLHAVFSAHLALQLSARDGGQ